MCNKHQAQCYSGAFVAYLTSSNQYLPDLHVGDGASSHRTLPAASSLGRQSVSWAAHAGGVVKDVDIRGSWVSASERPRCMQRELRRGGGADCWRGRSQKQLRLCPILHQTCRFHQFSPSGEQTSCPSRAGNLTWSLMLSPGRCFFAAGCACERKTRQASNLERGAEVSTRASSDAATA
jgi:hypothetical protein